MSQFGNLEYGSPFTAITQFWKYIICGFRNCTRCEIGDNSPKYGFATDIHFFHNANAAASSRYTNFYLDPESAGKLRSSRYFRRLNFSFSISAKDCTQREDSRVFKVWEVYIPATEFPPLKVRIFGNYATTGTERNINPKKQNMGRGYSSMTSFAPIM